MKPCFAPVEFYLLGMASSGHRVFTWPSFFLHVCQKISVINDYIEKENMTGLFDLVFLVRIELH